MLLHCSCFYFFFLMIRRPPRSTRFPYDALPISEVWRENCLVSVRGLRSARRARRQAMSLGRSEEHTSELQSRVDLVCRLLLEKKKKKKQKSHESQHNADARVTDDGYLEER